MKLLSDREASEWCAQFGLDVEADGGSPAVRLASGESPQLRVLVPQLARDVVTFGYVLLMSAISTDDELDFQGALLWLRDWDIWSSTTERVGLQLLAGMRMPDEKSTDIRSAPAHLLAASEIAATQSLLLLPLLFQWDAIYLPPAGGFACVISHHGFITFHARDDATVARLRARFVRAGYESDEIRDA